MARITFISDTHEKHKQLELPGGDILIHAGDLSNRGYKPAVQQFLDWFNVQDYRHKIFIAGNHDFLFENQRSKAVELMAEYPDVTYLEQSGIEIDGIKIWGSPWQPWFHDWAFNLSRGEELRELWLQIPLDTDILVTHTPPKGYGDFTIRDHQEVGCWDLFDVITSQVNPKYHVFGHIHEGYGVFETERTTFINASVVDFMYNVCNPPITIDY
jgi:Icc-related predicted phosphoesterase